jgi:hypothetical protein
MLERFAETGRGATSQALVELDLPSLGGPVVPTRSAPRAPLSDADLYLDDFTFLASPTISMGGQKTAHGRPDRACENNARPNLHPEVGPARNLCR